MSQATQPDTTSWFPASVRAPSRDVEIIRVCEQLVDIHHETMAFLDSRTTIEEEHRTEPQLTALYKRERQTVDQLERLGPPTTKTGVVAMAKAALATWTNAGRDEVPIADCDSQWLALVVIEQIAAGGLA